MNHEGTKAQRREVRIQNPEFRRSGNLLRLDLNSELQIPNSSPSCLRALRGQSGVRALRRSLAFHRARRGLQGFAQALDVEHRYADLLGQVLVVAEERLRVLAAL